MLLFVNSVNLNHNKGWKDFGTACCGEPPYLLSQCTSVQFNVQCSCLSKKAAYFLKKKYLSYFLKEEVGNYWKPSSFQSHTIELVCSTWRFIEC